MNFVQLVIMASAALTASGRIPSQLETRAFTGPPCMSDFQWSDNEENISPCDLAATVYGSCAGPDWTLKPLNDSSYDPPAGSLVNQCSCSWAAYNLVSMCTLCQGVDEGVHTWPTYSTNCTGQTSSQYFPSTQALADDTGIPFYAVTDPTTWADQRFNVDEARTIHNQGHQDVVQSSPHKSSSNVGPIVGGVIGGLAVFSLAGGLAFYMYRRKQKRTQPSVTHFGSDGSKHTRKMSDLSQKSGIGYGYQQLERSFATSPSSQSPLSPTTGTMHTHTASATSLSYFGSVRHSVLPYGASASPPPAARAISPAMLSSRPPNTQGLNREDIIVPFTLPPTDTTASNQGSNANLPDRKQADGARIPVYDPPNSLPTHVAPADVLSDSSTHRVRVNPPAYSDVDDASVAPSRAVHSKKSSTDTRFSADSKTGGAAPVVQRHSGPGRGSISAIDDVISQMGFSGQESVSGGGTISTGQSGQLPGARPFRPVLGNPDSRS